MPKILVTSGNTRVAYAICRSLAENGYEVYIGDQNSFTMAGMSRFCKGRMTYPSPFTKQQEFIESLVTFMKQESIDIILPVLEETFTCLKHKEILKNAGVAFFLPEYSDALALHAKGTLTAISQELNIDVPPTWELEEVLNSATCREELPFPVIVKPKQGGGGWGMKKFTSAADLYTVTSSEIEFPQNYIVQSIVQGQLIGVCGIYHQGKCIASDSYISTTVYPLRVGQPTTRLTQAFPQAIEAMNTLLAHMQWDGVCEIDFIFDEKNNKSYLIDANPRFWGSIKHNIAANVNYPLYYALLAQNITNFSINEAQADTRTRWLGGDILRVLAETKESKNKLQYIYNTIFKPLHYTANDDWDIKDPLPFITWGINLILNKLLRRKKDALPGVWE